jgi:hypothetical protein
MSKLIRSIEDIMGCKIEGELVKWLQNDTSIEDELQIRYNALRVVDKGGKHEVLCKMRCETLIHLMERVDRYMGRCFYAQYKKSRPSLTMVLEELANPCIEILSRDDVCTKRIANVVASILSENTSSSESSSSDSDSSDSDGAEEEEQEQDGDKEHQNKKICLS